MTKLTVVRCTPSSNDGYIVGLQAEASKKVTGLGTVISPFGKKYLVKLANSLAEGQILEIDLNEFDLREDNFIGDNGETINVTWLNPR